MPSPDDGLRPLTNEDFAELEKQGGRELSPEIRDALNSHLLYLCGPHGDRLVGRQAKRASRTKELRQLREDISRLAQDGQRIQEKFAALRSWMYHRNALTQPLFSSEETLISGGLDALVERAQRESTNDYLRRTVKPGPKPNEWYRAFFFGAADVFHEAGGQVSAASQRDKGGRNNSPFMRFLLFLHARLPPEQRKPACETLGEWAHKTGIPEWEHSRQG